ncbi:serine-threonine kinase receptor-associated protein [Planococcus citri]|uniref:serine-threonine kinase receptor-associated protein n=1 Tax=Planococcus citri TaxID=170843 RepID=UPI0031F7EC8E
MFNMSVKQVPLTCGGHTRPVVNLAFSGISEHGYFLISACKDGKPMLRQGETGDWIGTFEGHKGAVWGVALNHDGTKAATGAADFSAKIWNAVTGEEILSLQHNHIVKSVDFSSDGNYFVTGSNEKIIRVFDLNKLDEAPATFVGHTNNLKHVTFFNNDKMLVSCSEDQTLRIWDRISGQEVQKINFSSCPNSLEVSQDETTFTVAHGNSVSFLTCDGLSCLQEMKIPTKVYSASLHPNKSVFVCGGEDLIMYKYDYISGIELEAYKGHFGPLHCVRFSPDGELYASGSEDGTVRLWQTNVGKSYGLWKCADEPNVIFDENQSVPVSV